VEAQPILVFFRSFDDVHSQFATVIRDVSSRQTSRLATIRR